MLLSLQMECDGKERNAKIEVSQEGRNIFFYITFDKFDKDCIYDPLVQPSVTTDTNTDPMAALTAEINGVEKLTTTLPFIIALLFTSLQYM